MDIFVHRSALPSADLRTGWLAHLIEAMEGVTASAELCEPAIVEALSSRLEIPALPKTRAAAATDRAKGKGVS
jgi:hypothetical protein